MYCYLYKTCSTMYWAVIPRCQIDFPYARETFPTPTMHVQVDLKNNSATQPVQYGCYVVVNTHTSPVELTPLDVDTVLAHCHAEVLHSKHRPPLTTALAAAAVSRPLDSQVVVLSLRAAVFTALRRGGCAWCSSRAA
jgi:hypothetical protein